MPTPPPNDTAAERRRAFTAQVRSHHTLLLRYAQRRLRYYCALGMLEPGEMAPEELVNHAVLQALRRLPEKRPEQGFFPWFRRIADTVLRRFAQRAANLHRHTVSLEQPVGHTENGEPVRLQDILPDPAGQSPFAVLERQELERAITQALDCLPDEWRESFLMATLDGMTPADISLLEGRSPDDIRDEIRLARGFLREALPYAAEEYGPPGRVA
ncbi:MAG: sigma-70 family RNA polymerase sigma factor [Chloroflexi bacterium]|nr:sigma-70 family RNA polymerase sigma factor [Chloroflexota bacterium]